MIRVTPKHGTMSQLLLNFRSFVPFAVLYINMRTFITDNSLHGVEGIHCYFIEQRRVGGPAPIGNCIVHAFFALVFRRQLGHQALRLSLQLVDIHPFLRLSDPKTGV